MKILPFKVVAYNKIKNIMEYFEESNKDDYEMISGSSMRALAREGKNIPENFMLKEGWEILSNFYKK
jgi:3'-phosphoadenosine 5'-phosphosulfate synthase